MRWFFFIAPLLLSVPAGAQPMTCVRAAIPPATIRAEGMAELVSDIVLNCSGGQAGVFEILVISNTPLANRTFLRPTDPDTDPASLLSPSPANTMPWNDAFLLVDEPAPNSQVPCLPPDGADRCSPSGGAGPNVFQGRQLLDNSVVFQHVPLIPAADGGTRVIRISSVRVDAVRIPPKPFPGKVSLAVQIFAGNGDAVTIRDAERNVAEAQPGFTFSLRTAADGPVPSLLPASVTTPALLPQGPGQNANRFNLKFTEGFPSAFRRRNAGTSSDDPLYVASQALPAIGFHTESGFLNGDYPAANGMNLAGLADSGTRLKVVFEKVPDNITISVSTRDIEAGTSGFSLISPKAMLTGTDWSGAGPFNPRRSADAGMYQLPVQNGTATVVWEVVSSDPQNLEEISFAVTLASSADRAPGFGTATVRGTLAPVSSGSALNSLPLPRFREEITPDSTLAAFRISPTLQITEFRSVSAASLSGSSVAPESLIAGFAAGLPSGSVDATGLASSAGISISVIDANGVRRPAELISLPSEQVTYVLDKDTAMGPAVVNVTRQGSIIATGQVQVDRIAPALFSADRTGRGPADGEVTRIGASTQTNPIARLDPVTGVWATAPLDLGGDTDINLLVLRGTGLRRRSALSNVALTIGGEPVPIQFAGADQAKPGMDLITGGPLPMSLRGRGQVMAVLTVDGKTANRVMLEFR